MRTNAAAAAPPMSSIAPVRICAVVAAACAIAGVADAAKTVTKALSCATPEDKSQVKWPTVGSLSAPKVHRKNLYECSSQEAGFVYYDAYNYLDGHFGSCAAGGAADITCAGRNSRLACEAEKDYCTDGATAFTDLLMMPLMTTDSYNATCGGSEGTCSEAAKTTRLTCLAAGACKSASGTAVTGPTTRATCLANTATNAWQPTNTWTGSMFEARTKAATACTWTPSIDYVPAGTDGCPLYPHITPNLPISSSTESACTGTITKKGLLEVVDTAVNCDCKAAGKSLLFVDQNQLEREAACTTAGGTMTCAEWMGFAEGICSLMQQNGHADDEVAKVAQDTGEDGFVPLLLAYADKDVVTIDQFQAYLGKPPMDIAYLLFLLVAILFLFCGIAIVCDDFFTASLEQLSIKFELSEDVAGATFMAAGSSAPELFTSLASVLFEDKCNNRSSVGIGTIVGSAIFNILIIIGATAMLTENVLQLSWRPLVRDSCWYGFSILLLIIFVVGDTQKDKITGKEVGYVTWWEGMIMWICYLLYILFMKFNTQIMGESDNTVIEESIGERVRKNSVVDAEGAEGGTETDAALTEKSEPAKVEDEDEDEGEVDCLGVPKPEDLGGAVFTYFSYVWYLVFMATIPTCEPIEDGATRNNWCHRPNMYWVSFFMSIVWIGVICWGMVECAIVLGEMLGISATVMGLTVLSAGTSVPDAISSIVVAQRGMGDMAVSNALGSNVFDILLGLGFPYFLASLIHEPSAEELLNDPLSKNSVKMCTEDVVVYVVCLAGVLVLVIGTFVAFKFQLHPKLGIILISTYALFAAFAILRDVKIIDAGGSCDAGH